MENSWTKEHILDGVAYIQRKLEDLASKAGDVAADSTPTPTPTIYPLPSFLRQTALERYEPALLPIGPYHQEPGALKRDKKMFHLRDLLSRTEGKSVKDCVAAIMELESSAMSCYKDTERIRQWGRPEFVVMLVMDGCFIIELLYKFYLQNSESTLSGGWSRCILWIDLLKLENQIPFFVLEELFDQLLFPVITTSFPGTESKALLRRLALEFLTNNKAESQHISDQLLGDVHHLLHLYYLWLTPRTQEKRQSCSCWVVLHLISANRLILFLRILAEILMTMIFCPHRLLRYILMKPSARSKRQQPPLLPRLQPSITIPCATQLEEDGVKFAKKRKWTSLCDITFSRCRGIMEIPQLSIDSETIALFANLIPYEQRHHGDQKKYMISYMFLMGCLINSSKDVAALRKREIIVSDQDDKDVADFFKKICRSCDLTKLNYYYAHLSDNVKEYHKFKLLKWRAYIKILKRDYFGNPWALISFLATVIIPFLTISQTFLTIYLYYLKTADD